MSNAPKNPGLDGRAREKSGQIDHKHPTTKIKHLREHYRQPLPPIGRGSALSVSYSRKPVQSLSQYVKHHGHQPVAAS